MKKTVLLLTIFFTLSLHSACDLLYPDSQFHVMVKTESGIIEGVEGETALYKWWRAFRAYQPHGHALPAGVLFPAGC